MAWPAHRFAPGIDIERHAAAHAEGAIDEGHRAPAGSAERMRLEEASLAGHAKRRKQKIEHGTNAMTRGPPGAGGPGGAGGDACSPLQIHGLTLTQDELRASTHFRRPSLPARARARGKAGWRYFPHPGRRGPCGGAAWRDQPA